MANQNSNSYVGRHAELYDLFYKDKPYSEESAFMHHCIQTYGNSDPKRILELACGTGTHSLLLEKYGYEITATDYSIDMLKQAQKKAKANNSRVIFLHQDMRELQEPTEKFDAVLCLFDSIGYVITNDNILKVLLGIKKQLSSTGVLIFEFWHAGAMLKSYDPVRVRRWIELDREILRISETSVDYSAQTCSVAYTIIEQQNDQNNIIKETQTNRFFLVQEMNLFLEKAGFCPIKWFSGYSQNEVIDSSTWHILCVARVQE